VTQPSSAELADFLVEWREGPWPLDWGQIFGRAAPLVLEIGFGNGEFLLDQAERSPERDHVGLELSWSATARLLRRLAPSRGCNTSRLPNVRAVLADAEVALQRLFASESLAEVFVNHPCPWPKTRHHERRLLGPEGLALLAERMRTGARLTVVTDHAEYAAWLADALGSQQALVSCHATAAAPEPAGRRTTKYQRLAMAAGAAIHYFEWRKARAPAAVLLPTDPPGPMPSLTLQGRHDERALFDGFRPELRRETRDGFEVAVRLLDVYRREPVRSPHSPHSSGAWLVEALVLEGRLRQQFAILVVPRGERELLVKLADLARPYPTFGVKRALEAVARFLLARHPELSLVHHNLGAELLSDAAPPPPAEDPGAE
jgi:tRNA (guanine-N7-)-methyltransferase